MGFRVGWFGGGPAGRLPAPFGGAGFADAGVDWVDGPPVFFWDTVVGPEGGIDVKVVALGVVLVPWGPLSRIQVDMRSDAVVLGCGWIVVRGRGR